MREASLSHRAYRSVVGAYHWECRSIFRSLGTVYVFLIIAFAKAPRRFLISCLIVPFSSFAASSVVYWCLLRTRARVGTSPWNRYHRLMALIQEYMKLMLRTSSAKVASRKRWTGES
ncbi:hypothetical protein F5B17DRAFT_386659 [Nemania serpens]|nr:hypothetical protein F5B17DRAFT_386659 [Nemania serpens]